MPIDPSLIPEIFEWDTYNWSKALPFWEAAIEKENLNCLEIGAFRGGPSLWLSLLNNKVLCTDIKNPKERAEPFHLKHQAKNISYSELDALNIPYNEEFDIIIFKSVLGGISRDGKSERMAEVIDQIHKALKPGGKLLFAENLAGSGLHRFLRSKTRKWGDSWNYLNSEDADSLFSSFSKCTFNRQGFFSAFGPNEMAKKLLGIFDSLFELLIPDSKKYILFGVCEK